MKKLSQEAFKAAEDWIKEKGRGLENSLFALYFSGGEKKGVINELKKYQNEDGGFGRALEPDFRMPFSSPLATSIGLRIIAEIDAFAGGREMVKKAINYLENSFVAERKGWFAVCSRVNDFDHTPWWYWDEEKGMTVIDYFWGNPSAELIAYLYKYQDLVKEMDVEELLETALQKIEKRKAFESEHELYCFLRLYREITPKSKSRIEDTLTGGIAGLVEYDREKWIDYVPSPLNFVPSPNDNSFGITKDKIEENLDFLIEILEKEGYVFPPWGDDFYQGKFREAVPEWEGILTLEALKLLASYNCLNQ